MCILVTVRSYIAYNNSFPVANHKKCNSSLEVVEGQIQHCLCEKKKSSNIHLRNEKDLGKQTGERWGKRERDYIDEVLCLNHV